MPGVIDKPVEYFYASEFNDHYRNDRESISKSPVPRRLNIGPVEFAEWCASEMNYMVSELAP